MRRRWLKQVLLERVVIHTTSNLSIEGLLSENAKDGVVLKTAKMLGPHPTDLAGEVFIPREQVAFAQKPG